jgi:hypothetical protein
LELLGVAQGKDFWEIENMIATMAGLPTRRLLKNLLRIGSPDAEPEKRRNFSLLNMPH